MRNFLLFLCLLSGLSGWLPAQQTWQIQGRIVDAEKGEAIPFVTVFVANTSFGTAADPEGRFRLTLPEAFAEVVFSAVGYESFVLPISADTLQGKLLRIALKEKEIMLKEAVVTANNAQWKMQYQNFLYLFLSTTPNAAACKILNPEVLDFDQVGRVFKASASDLIIIENQALGYRIKYELKRFEVDYTDQYFVVLGYPYFESLPGNARQQKRWEQARLNSYKGSTMHLMRSIHQRNWVKEGFELWGLIRTPNEDRVPDEVIKEQLKKLMRNSRLNTNNQDSLQFWVEQKNKPEYIHTLTEEPLSPDSIVRKHPEQALQVLLVSENYIQVAYKQPPAKGYFGAKDKSKQESVLQLLKPEVAIREDGSLVEPLDILYEGYLAWPKMADMLPLDYQPPKTKK
jgi:hypothetical protein